jgi:mRNA interferase MazF
VVESGDAWVPDEGDLVWVELGPVVGNEQDGRRSALVLSAADINSLTRRVIVLPITRTGRGWPTELALPEGVGLTGFVQCDQIRSLSWAARHARKAGHAGVRLLAEARGVVALLIGLKLPGAGT